jgi:hypothetical protein
MNLLKLTIFLYVLVVLTQNVFASQLCVQLRNLQVGESVLELNGCIGNRDHRGDRGEDRCIKLRNLGLDDRSLRIEGCLKRRRSKDICDIRLSPHGHKITEIYNERTDEIPSVGLPRNKYSLIGGSEISKTLRTIRHAESNLNCKLRKQNCRIHTSMLFENNPRYRTRISSHHIINERGNKIVWGNTKSMSSINEQLDLLRSAGICR